MVGNRLKHVGVPKLRCKHCYFMVKDEVKYVMCTAKRRHLQVNETHKLIIFYIRDIYSGHDIFMKKGTEKGGKEEKRKE